MMLALYSIVISAVFVGVAVANPHVADALVVAFFALLLVPATVHLGKR